MRSHFFPARYLRAIQATSGNERKAPATQPVILPSSSFLFTFSFSQTAGIPEAEKSTPPTEPTVKKKKPKKFTFDVPTPVPEQIEKDVLMTYSKRGPIALFQHFLNPTNIESKDADNKTLLHIAAINRDVDRVKLLLRKNANTEAVANYTLTIRGAKQVFINLTPLLGLAILPTQTLSDAKRKIIIALVKHGANINAVDSLGETALHWAAYRNNLELFILLLKLGANPTIQGKNNRLVSDYARHNPKMLALLKEAEKNLAPDMKRLIQA